MLWTITITTAWLPRHDVMQAVQADQARGGGVEHPVQGWHLLPIDRGNVKQQPKLELQTIHRFLQSWKRPLPLVKSFHI